MSSGPRARHAAEAGVGAGVADDPGPQAGDAPVAPQAQLDVLRPGRGRAASRPGSPSGSRPSSPAGPAARATPIATVCSASSAGLAAERRRRRAGRSTRTCSSVQAEDAGATCARKPCGIWRRDVDGEPRPSSPPGPTRDGVALHRHTATRWLTIRARTTTSASSSGSGPSGRAGPRPGWSRGPGTAAARRAPAPPPGRRRPAAGRSRPPRAPRRRRLPPRSRPRRRRPASPTKRTRSVASGGRGRSGLTVRSRGGRARSRSAAVNTATTPGSGARRGRVDPGQLGVGHRRPHEGEVQGAGEREVADEGAPAREQLAGPRPAGPPFRGSIPPLRRA